MAHHHEGNESTSDLDDDIKNDSDFKVYFKKPFVEASFRTLRSRTTRQPISQIKVEDKDYGDSEEDQKKAVMIGSAYQAIIPEGLSKYDDALPYENNDKLIWDPDKMSEDCIESYLLKCEVHHQRFDKEVHAILPTGKLIRDDERALYVLMQCGYNKDEALRCVNTASCSDTSKWSSKECRNFEIGFDTYGKNFRRIQKTNLQTRSLGEIVKFYYLWKTKKNIYANKARLGQRKNIH